MSVREKIRDKYKGQKKAAIRKADPSVPAKDLQLQIEYLPIESLNPATYNPREMSEDAMEKLKKGLQEFGFCDPIVLNKDMTIVGGHQRWHAAKAIGMTTVPCVTLDLTKRQEKALNIALNKISGEFVADMLTELLRDIYDSGMDMDLTGFADDELAELLGIEDDDEQLGEEDPIVEPVPDPFVIRGDLWIMGEQRLLCGDSTNADDIDRLMGGEQADCVVTDPPYNVAYETKAGKIENDNLSPEAFREFLLAVFSAMHDALKPGGCFYIYHAEGNNIGDIFRSAVNSIPGLLMKQCLVWVKNAMVLSRSDYSWKHEPILYGWKAGAAHYYDGDFTRTTVIDDDVDISKLDKRALRDIITEMRNREPSSVIRVDRPAKSDIHPTCKPVRLFEKNVYASTRPNETVLDLFSGSGTTLVTCRKTGRRGRGMELSPGYAEASLKRYWDYCGEEPQLLGADGTMVPFSEVEKQRKNIMD